MCNDRNLQAAICSYFDYEQPSHRLPSMKLVSDVTIGEGEEVPPNCKFTKTWRIANTGLSQHNLYLFIIAIIVKQFVDLGDDSWPTGCCLRFTDGDQMCHSERVLVDSLLPGDTCDISVDMISPQKPGIYQGQWRMSTSTGQFFGGLKPFPFKYISLNSILLKILFLSFFINISLNMRTFSNLI